MPLSIYMAFMWAPPAEILGDAGRILYFHVPLAWVSTLAFIISGVYSIIYLYDEKKNFFLIDEKAYNSAVLGMIFMILTVITGSIWSKISWGAYWNWDPRQTSIIILLLIYVAYFSLSAALADNPSRGKLASSYLVIAMAAVPFLIFIVPRVYTSLHPDTIINPDNAVKLDDRMKITLLVSSVSFTFLFFYLLSIAGRLSKINQRIKEKKYEKN